MRSILLRLRDTIVTRSLFGECSPAPSLSSCLISCTLLSHSWHILGTTHVLGPLLPLLQVPISLNMNTGQRDPDPEQSPRDRVLEEVRVRPRVQDERRKARRDR